MKYLLTILKYLLFIGIVILLVVIACKYERVPEGMVEVRRTWLDSLEAVAATKPDTIIITETDTVKIDTPIIVEIEIPVYIPYDTLLHLDTLKTDYFALYLRDKYYASSLQRRSFTYDVYIPEKIITVTEKIPFPYEVTIDLPKIYGGVQMGTIISADLSYRQGSNFYGAGIGYGAAGRFYYLRYQFGIY